MPDPRRAPLLLVLALAAAGCQSAPPGQSSPPPRPRGSTAVQALVGVAEFRDFEFTRTGPGGETATADLSTMPALGFAGQYRLGGNNIEFGLDGGLLFSWDGDAETVAVGGGGAVVTVDRDLLITDLFLGGYASAMLGEHFRIYGGVGPSLMWGNADYADELVSDSGSAFGVGWYVRAGAEFRLADRNFLGLGARWVDTELDFGGAIGDVDAAGIQVFLTYTQGF